MLSLVFTASMNHKTGYAHYSLLHCCLCKPKKKLNKDKSNYEEINEYLWDISVSCPNPTHKP